MKLASVTIKNFKGIGATGLTIQMPETVPDRPGSGDFVSIVGENNACKSSILQAIQLALGGAKPALDYFHNHDAANALEVTMYFRNVNTEGLEPEVATYLGNAAVRWQWSEPGKTAAVTIQNPSKVFVKPPTKVNTALNRLLPEPVLVAAVKDQSEVAGVGKKDTPVRQLIEKIIAPQMQAHEVVKDFGKAAQGVKAYLETKPHGPAAQLERRLTEMMGSVIDVGASVRFNPPELSSQLHENVQVRLVQGTLETRPEHQGHGTQRTLILSLTQILAEDVLARQIEGSEKSILLLFEEPEIYLHPQMCRKMRDALLMLARSGKFQIICTTHSPVFLDLADRHEGIVRMLRNPDGAVIAIQRSDQLFSGENANQKRARLRMLLNFDASVNEVFFARNVCLIEGDTERAAVHALAQRLIELGISDQIKTQKALRDATLVNCRGKWTIVAFQEVLNYFTIPYRVIHDRDEDETESGASGRILAALGNDSSRSLVHDRNFEEALFTPPLTGRRDKPWHATQQIQAMTQIEPAAERFFLFALATTMESLAPSPPMAATPQ